MTSILSVINSFVPFADPSRPLWRDILLSAALCTLLYVAPQIDFTAIRQSLSRQTQSSTSVEPPHNDSVVQNGQDAHIDDQRHEEGRGNVAEVAHEDADEDDHDVQQEEPGQAGPADAAPNPHQPRPRDPNREVGAKKAKSIARRNQQRAYNEWLREQGDAQRAEWARDEAKVQQEIQSEKERRAAVEAKIREKERQEREKRRMKEEEEHANEIQAAKTALEMVVSELENSNLVSVEAVVRAVRRDPNWLRQQLKRESVLGLKEVDGQKQQTMITSSGWIVRIRTSSMNAAYASAAESSNRTGSKISWNDFGQHLKRATVSG